MKTTAHFRTALCAALTIALGSSVPTGLRAQGTCADLNIVSVTYAAFNNTSIEVIAHAAPGAFFSYPSFSMVNEGGDTLTREQVNFFGIGESEQTHSSTLLDGQVLPSSPFTGDIVFTYYGLDEQDTCVYDFDGSLCPADPCNALQVFVFNSGSLVDATFTWSMTDDEGTLVGSGTLDIEAVAQQTDLDSLCLPAGAYTLHVGQLAGPPGAYRYGVTRNLFTTIGPESVFFQNQSNDLPFTFFEPCFEGTNSIEEQVDAVIGVTIADRIITLTRQDGSPLGMIDVFDASGRRAHRAQTSDGRTSLDLGSFSAGVYLLHVHDPSSNGTTSFAQRIILN